MRVAKVKVGVASGNRKMRWDWLCGGEGPSGRLSGGKCKASGPPPSPPDAGSQHKGVCLKPLGCDTLDPDPYQGHAIDLSIVCIGKEGGYGVKAAEGK